MIRTAHALERARVTDRSEKRAKLTERPAARTNLHALQPALPATFTGHAVAVTEA